MDRALALDVPNHPQYSVFWRCRDQDVNMAQHQMAFLDLAFTLLRQIAEDLTQVLAEAFVKHLPAPLRDKYNMILQVPFSMA